MRFVGIDPATATGFVALNERGEVLVAKELKGKGRKEKGGISVEQLVSLEDMVSVELLQGDEIVMEAAAQGTQMAFTTGMIHGGIRTAIHRKALAFNTVNPLSVKKFVGVTGWTGPAGNKRRLTGKEKKEEIEAAVNRLFDFTHKSDNVVDAYIIARIALNIYLYRELRPVIDTASYQIEVVRDILIKREGA